MSASGENWSLLERSGTREANTYHRDDEHFWSYDIAVFVNDLDVPFPHHFFCFPFQNWRGIDKSSSREELEQSSESHFQKQMFEK
jgi:hypothetical protein